MYTQISRSLGYSIPSRRILRILNLSDEYNDVMRIVFSNGYELSIIRPAGGLPRGYGSGAYGGKDTYEIAVFDPEGEFTREFFPCQMGDDVLGYQTVSQVKDIAVKVADR